MLSIKRLPTLSASKIQSKLHFALRNGIQEKQINKHCHMNILNLCRSFSVLHHIANKSRNPQLRQFNAEYKAACDLLKRSNLPVLNSVLDLQKRGLHKSPPQSSQQDDKDKDKKDKKKGDIDNNIPTLLMKAAFWMMTTFLLLVLSSLRVPSDNAQNEMVRYVSWNEFVYIHTMLSKGEVEELIVRPDMEVVTIILHEAIVKGKRSTHRVYHMNVGDIHRFEEKLRETEKNLGVKEGVRVIYDRNGSVAGKFITTLLIAAVILSFLYS